MKLLIDLGNSRLKWAEYSPERWSSGALSLDSEKDATSLYCRAWGNLEKPQLLVVCSVSSPDRQRALEDWARTTWSLVPIQVRSQVGQLGVKNLYRRPDQLGADRWAALIGARGLTAKAACVVDAGTAVTVDALSDQGEYLGGAIFPGLKLLRESLVRGTAGIPAVQNGYLAKVPAISTEEGVAAGTWLGLAGAIERLLEEQRLRLGGEPEIYLTGGDAPQLSAQLQMASTLVPDLVLKGLARIADSLTP